MGQPVEAAQYSHSAAVDRVPYRRCGAGEHLLRETCIGSTGGPCRYYVSLWCSTLHYRTVNSVIYSMNRGSERQGSGRGFHRTRASAEHRALQARRQIHARPSRRFGTILFRYRYLPICNLWIVGLTAADPLCRMCANTYFHVCS